jgi:plasmid replication initiation protein
MAQDIVVKANWLNQAITPLTLPELRIIQLAVIDARETGKGLSADSPLRIEALRYAEAFNTTRQNAYARLREAENSLFKRQFSFIDDDKKPVKSHWIQDVKYFDDEGAIEICLTRQVVRGISRIDGVVEFFTEYLLSQTAKLNSAYAVRLYELLIQWRSVGKTPVFELGVFKGQLGLSIDEYQRMDHFKTRVLDLAVAQINEHTDITASYEQHKAGRVIKGFSFKFKQKTKLVDAPIKPKKPEPPKASTSFAGLQLVLLKEIQKKHPEITEKYVRDYAEQSGKDIVQVLEKIKADYKAAEHFSLEKTD